LCTYYRRFTVRFVYTAKLLIWLTEKKQIYPKAEAAF
jgi:hypothetical protein